MFARVFLIILICVTLLGLSWYLLFSLKQQPMETQEIVSMYQYTKSEEATFKIEAVEERIFKFSYLSYDGELVEGKISYPIINKIKYPVLIGMHAMGRSYPRWWVDSIGDRETVTHVNHITETADALGYVVVAIDARYHGSRKDPQRGLRSIMTDLHFWGEKEHYQNMIYQTVLDYRVLLDWIEKQPEFDTDKISVAGYSMGGQMSLLLAGVDTRIDSVISIVPPYVDDKVALVAPKNIVHRIHKPSVLLVTGQDDEYSSIEQNKELFEAISSQSKEHISYEGGHLLPKSYVADVASWMVAN